ncbi:MAG TPA: hypothetical protein GX505_08880 [Clostridiales bacterium]|nr:hypothetical protein [Clostridiales bacterium]
MADDFYLTSENSAAEAQWLIESVEKPWSRSKYANYAAAIIPRGFAAYTRLFHPAYLEDEDREITWSEITKYTGRTPHSQMQWHTIANFNNSDKCLKGLTAPYTGRLPERQAKILKEILRKYTSTPDNCYFAIWDGWGFPELEKLTNKTARFHLPDRSYYLIKGRIDTASIQTPSVPIQAAGIWWPADRAWCAATEVDMMWTYIGGTEDCINEILADNRLEAWKASLDDRVDINGDCINNI